MHSMQNVLDRSKTSNNKLKKAAERLSSGYRINRSSDDAAGLAVSEKLRNIRRGLLQGLRNIDDGVNYSRTVESAAQEMHNMLHRMKELAIEAANGTYDDDVDREAIDLEYQAIIDEIDQMSDTAHFNGVPLFEKHLSAYEKADGVVVHTEPVKIDSKNDTLTVGYKIGNNSQECTVQIPHGTYSAEEIADLVDTMLYDEAPELIIGMNTDKQFTMQAEGGKIDYISGSAASLFYETVIGSSDGYLLGVTTFESDAPNVQLQIISGKNDTMSFRVGNTDDTLYSITIDPGKYNRPALIDAINQKIEEAGIPGDVKAVAETNDDGKYIIGIASKKTITGLAGNFIMMDGITSPIYDICKYGYIDNTEAVLSGTKRIPLDMEIERGRNEYFVMNFGYYDDDGNGQTQKLRIDLLADDENVKVYASPDDLVATIQQQIDDAGIPVTVSINARGGLDFKTEQYGDKCSIKLDKSDVPSGHMVYDLFDSASLNKVGPSPASSTYNIASLVAQKKLDPSVYIPADENTLTFDIVLSDSTSGPETKHTINVTLDGDNTYTQAQLVEALNNKMDAAYPDLGEKLIFSCQGNSIRLSANGNKGKDVERITVSSASSAYDRLIKGVSYYQNSYTKEIKNGSENAYATMTDKVPGTSRNNVTSTSGSSDNGISYRSEQDADSQKTDSYIKSSTAAVTNNQGTTVYEESNEGEVTGDKIKSTTPAVLKMPRFLSNFSNGDRSLRDMTLTFTLTDDEGDHDYSIFIPKGSTSAEALDKIKQEVKDTIDVSTNGNELIFTSKHSGKEALFKNISSDMQKYYYKSSYASDPDAVIDEANNKVYIPQTTTVPNVASHLPYTINSTCNRLIINAGPKTYDLRLTEKTYTSVQDFADEINRLISEKDGGNPTTTVAVSGTKGLIFTGIPTQTGSITISSSSSCKIGETLIKSPITSSPYYNPATGLVEKPATIRAEAVDTHFPKTVSAPDNTITMDYSYPNPGNPSSKITETLTINVPEGTYNSGSEFAAAVQQAINNDPDLSSKIKADYSPSGSNKGLTFTTVNGGNGYALSNLGGSLEIQKAVQKSSTSGGGTIDPGTNTVKFPAYIRNNRYNTLFDSVELEINDTNNFVSITINGTLYEFNIPEGVYSGSTGRAQLTQYLKDGLAGADVTITDSGSTLSITTNEGGADKSFVVNGSNTAPYFQGASTVGNPTATSRVEKPCCIIGKNNVSTIEIKDYYNSMSFDYGSGGNTYPIDITIEPKTYTAAELAQAIQDKIDEILPADCLDVSVNAGGNIVIKGSDISGDRTISNFEGKLFERVFQNASYSGVSYHTEKAGTSSGSYLTYIVGRNKLLPETEDERNSGKNVIIYPGLNDNIIFDFTYDGEVYTVDFNIPSGTYTPEELAEAVQMAGREKMNKLTDKNGDHFPQDSFQATIGLAPLGLTDPENAAIKSGDKLVLSFKIPDDGAIKNMQSIINGVRGNSAYRIFYDATQSPTPSKVIGKADLSDGVLIRSGVNDHLTFDLDGQAIDVNIPAGAYTCDQMVEFLNNEFEKADSIVRVINQEGHLMFYTTENGSYSIDKFRGNAADTLFYDTDERDSDTEIGIHIGRRTDSYIWYLKTRVDDHLMRVNTTGVTSIDRALKAVARIDSAVNYLSQWRALSGANENRSRHSYSRNQTYVENLENADSTLRDADIAQEVAAMSKQQILLQAQNAMMEQAKQQHSSVLDVLG